MIVPKMSIYQMYEKIEADKVKIEFEAQKLMPKIIKEIKKQRSFPYYKCVEYKPSSNNVHVIFFYAETKKDAEKPIWDFFTVLFNDRQRFVLKQRCEIYNGIGTMAIKIYTSHFFQRYKERKYNNMDLSKNELACRFFSKNLSFDKKAYEIPIVINEEINRNFKEYGSSNHWVMLVNEGLCFTRSCQYDKTWKVSKLKETEALLFIYTTFVSNSELKEPQKEALRKEYMNVYKEMYEDCKRNEAQEKMIALRKNYKDILNFVETNKNLL